MFLGVVTWADHDALAYLAPVRAGDVGISNRHMLDIGPAIQGKRNRSKIGIAMDSIHGHSFENAVAGDNSELQSLVDIEPVIRASRQIAIFWGTEKSDPLDNKILRVLDIHHLPAVGTVPIDRRRIRAEGRTSENTR